MRNLVLKYIYFIRVFFNPQLLINLNLHPINSFYNPKISRNVFLNELNGLGINSGTNVKIKNFKN